MLLLDALHDRPSDDPVSAFQLRWAFGELSGDPERDERTKVAAMWRAAALRNFSVAAWRSLWRWLAERLSEEPMTLDHLGATLAAAVEDMPVGEMIDSLPARIDGRMILPAELELQAEPGDPMRWIRELALGAQRTGDLDELTRRVYLGRDRGDLGPEWVAGLLEEERLRSARNLARTLADTLVRRAQRVALSKMYVRRDGRLFVPTRLHERDGIFWVRGEEHAGQVALRTDRLAQILSGLGFLDFTEERVFCVSERAEALRGRYS